MLINYICSMCKIDTTQSDKIKFFDFSHCYTVHTWEYIIKEFVGFFALISSLLCCGDKIEIWILE